MACEPPCLCQERPARAQADTGGSAGSRSPSWEPAMCVCVHLYVRVRAEPGAGGWVCCGSRESNSVWLAVCRGGGSGMVLKATWRALASRICINAPEGCQRGTHTNMRRPSRICCAHSTTEHAHSPRSEPACSCYFTL
eukprot:scaffold71162_cov73-Phaeocystis_antarctica.AAC.2